MSTADELALLDATAQAELVRSGELSARELVTAAIERIERGNPVLNAVIRNDFERALERAASSGRSAPFAGVPTLLKDIGAAEAGQACHFGMRLLKQLDHRESEDSHFLRRLLAAGFIPLGRTNMPELAIMATSEPESYGATRNPWNTEHSAGGSSGGSAAAVAAGMVPVAHASDGGGSIRGPASMCGLVGLKPTRARCSFGPQRGERWSSLSVEFMLTRSVRDCAALLDVLAEQVPGDPYGAPPPQRPYIEELRAKPAPLRIGVVAHGLRGVPLAPECEAAVRDMARTLESLGHRVEDAYPAVLDDTNTPWLWVQLVCANIARTLDVFAEKVGRTIGQDDVEPLTFALAQIGRQLTATQHIANIDKMHAYGRTLAAFWESGFDLLLTPTQGAPPARIGELTSTVDEPFRAMVRAAPYGVFTLPFNLSGQPAISLPTAWSASSLPIGTQLVAAIGREDLLLCIASQIEQVTAWSVRRPPDCGREVISPTVLSVK
jgi:amidase